MSNSTESIHRLRMEEGNDKILRVACNILRTLLVLGGAGWKNELTEGLTAITAEQNDSGSIASLDEVENALNILGEKDLIDHKKGKRTDPSGTTIIEDNLYSLKDHIATSQVFGADKAVMILRGR